MQIAPSTDRLPLVRRLEAVGFRAWPAASVHYDGSWQVRLTGGYPSKRLNSVVPLDPSDTRDLPIRLERARKKFEAYGRPLLVRETPLMPLELRDLLSNEGWSVFEEVLVMTSSLDKIELPDTMDHLPGHDIGRFVEAYLKITGSNSALQAPLAEIISSIKPTVGLFLKEEVEEAPQATVLCVQDNDLAGIMSLAVVPELRGKGYGAEMLAAAMRWARMRSARTAWLQVVSTNAPAIAIYERFGFTEAYRHRYWRKGA
ncbi:MAG: GNAT family N-acetyltransferase [Proteobacteria bacterium]|nr:GNAT family N-acetyltransferase [Pseudomonadota bacterium]